MVKGQDESIFDCSCFNLRAAARLMTNLYDEVMSPSGLRTTQFAVLAAVEERGPMMVQELAFDLVLDASSLTRTLQPLIDQGWIELRVGDDRRTRVVVLTRSGKTKVGTSRPYWHDAQRAVRKRFGETRAAQALSDSRSIVDRLRTEE